MASQLGPGLLCVRALGQLVQTSSYQSSFPMKNLMVSVALLGGIRISFFGQATNKVYRGPFQWAFLWKAPYAGAIAHMAKSRSRPQAF